jgi:hypothetical protein
LTQRVLLGLHGRHAVDEDLLDVPGLVLVELDDAAVRPLDLVGALLLYLYSAVPIPGAVIFV